MEGMSPGPPPSTKNTQQRLEGSNNLIFTIISGANWRDKAWVRQSTTPQSTLG